jgi:hypothetical protein
MIKDHADGIFWNLGQHIQKNQVVPGAVYVIGREQMQKNSGQIRDLVVSNTIDVVFSNPAEGSETINNHCAHYGILDLVTTKKIPVVTGGDQEPTWNYLQYDSFLPKLLDYDENVQAIQAYADGYTQTRPYKFLFLNGRGRSHRHYLLEKLQPWLDHTIWTNLDSANGTIKLLDPDYEIDQMVANMSALPAQGFVKHQLFNNTWADVLLKSNLYLDSYFSLVTETVHDYPYSFRTEKIWKPIAIGHPWIVSANSGFYRDLRNMGFQTFTGIIDESFDQIDNNQDRLDRLIEVVTDLCQQDLVSFLDSCYNICKYNQQHLAELGPQIRSEFPQKFLNFVHNHLERQST